MITTTAAATTTTTPNSRALILGMLMMLTVTFTAAFVPSPPCFTAAGGSPGISRDRPLDGRNKIYIKRTAPYKTFLRGIIRGRASSSAVTSTAAEPRHDFFTLLQWTRAMREAQRGHLVARHTGSRPRTQPNSNNPSTLFAAPELQYTVLGMKPLMVALNRSCAILVEPSCGSAPVFLFMASLIGMTFAPMVGTQMVGTWLVGRVGYRLAMSDADVSKRLPAGFLGYMFLFLLVGGFAFMNGLKAIVSLKLTII